METRINLCQKDMPQAWYNALPDLPTPLAPPRDPVTKEILTPEQL